MRNEAKSDQMREAHRVGGTAPGYSWQAGRRGDGAAAESAEEAPAPYAKTGLAFQEA